MSYVGNTPTTAAFPFDQFSGNGSTTAFTLSYAPAGTTSIIVSISGVVQNPNTYSVSGTTLTFTPAPPTGSNNIAVLYLGLPVVATLSPGNTAYFSSSVFTATAGQTVFTPSGTYQTGFINVIRNGSQLAPANYTATNGTTVTLANACTAGDIVVIEVFNLTSIAGALPVTGGTVTGATTFNSTVQVNGANVSGFTGFKNRIINPGMVIDQRNNGAAVTFTNSFPYSIDRWQIAQNTAATQTLTAQQSSVVPNGNFIRSLLITTTTGASVGAANYANVWQKIEGFNLYDFGWGTANAQSATVSFWVRSSLTGSFGFFIQNGANNRTFMTSFSIIAANTWQFVTINIPGDTSGTWNTGNGVGAYVGFDMGTGANGAVAASSSWQSTGAQGLTGGVQLSSTTGATFYVTGVQLERGSNATSYEFRSYGQELALCQRYYQRTTDYGCGTLPSSVAGYRHLIYPFKVEMRAAPTVTVTWNSGTDQRAQYVTATSAELVVNAGNTTSQLNVTSVVAAVEL